MMRAMLAIGFLALARTAAACSICFGTGEGHDAEAVNAAVITMSSVTLGVFAGFGYFAFQMIRRIRAYEADHE